MWLPPNISTRIHSFNSTTAPVSLTLASLASSLPPDIEETGWGVPLYDENVVERARTPRTSMDKPPSRRNSVDERHAPALKSLDLSTVRNKIADPPLR